MKKEIKDKFRRVYRRGLEERERERERQGIRERESVVCL